MLPSSVEAKPHCVLKARLFSGWNSAASLILAINFCGSSNSAFLLVTKPKTTSLSLGICTIGSKLPDLSLSNSR